MACVHSACCLQSGGTLPALYTARLCSNAHVLWHAAAVLCRVHVAKNLQNGSTYAAKVLPKVTINKSKARQQLQSKCLQCS
jgi:hypothetical protein